MYHVALAWATFLALPTLGGAELIGDFEDENLDGWTHAAAASTVSLARSETGASTGKGALQVKNTGSGYSWGAIQKNIFGDKTALEALSKPGAAVTIDFLASAGSVPAGQMNLTLLVNGDNGGSAANEQMAGSAATVDGTSHSMSFPLTNSAREILAKSNSWVFIGFSDNSDESRIWYVDNIRVVAPSDASPSSALKLTGNAAANTNSKAVFPSDPAPSNTTADQLVGKPDFIHLLNEDGIWWFVDHTGKRFITTGMNHIDENKILFNEVNKDWLQEKFGQDIKAPWGALNAKSENIGAFADMVVQNFKDYGFNTIPFHAYSVPLDLYEEREIYYVAKIKSQQICLTHMKRDKGERFPDVFSNEFRSKLNALTKQICTPLREAKYCLGYTFFDMPDLKSIRPFQKNKFKDKGLIYPWVQDMRALPASASGKQQWISVLKNTHASATKAAETFGLKGIGSWDELAGVTEWPVEPGDASLALKDAEDMFTAIAEQWYRLHHDLIKKYDPNHLIIGDKHDVGYDKNVHMIPDGVLQAIGKYTDVLMIQSYTHYADHHRDMLEELHQKCGLPILNGDHSYSCKNENQVKTKGIKLESQQAVAEAYHHYMKSIMQNHSYMLGWWHCGYIEQWAPAGTHLGQQCGFFTPFGEPRTDLLPTVKEANESAVRWHREPHVKQ